MAKDYYSILGVLPSAEQIVIRAAYRALSQIYHPDMESGDEEKMKEINEAYSTLNDPAKRKKYDDEFTSKVHQDADFGADAPSVDPLQADWDLAKEYFSGLDEIETKLKQASWKLALAYRALMLESKDWDNRQIIADNMYDDFLTTYFGENSKIKYFATRLITIGKKAALKELNRVVCVLGTPTDADPIIEKIAKKHLQDFKEFASDTVKCPFCHQMLAGFGRCTNCGSTIDQAVLNAHT